MPDPVQDTDDGHGAPIRVRITDVDGQEVVATPFERDDGTYAIVASPDLVFEDAGLAL